MSPHLEVTRERARLLQDQLVRVATWAENLTDLSARERILAPYRHALEELYETDMPLARLADDSDLLVHVIGPAASAPSPRVSLVTSILTQTRTQITRVAMEIAGITTLRVPDALDMDLVGLAGGSLFVGFSVAAPSAGASTEGHQLANASMYALDAFGRVGALVSGGRGSRDVAGAVEDPAVRDTVVAAVRHIAPSGRNGVTEVELLGRRIPGKIALTTDTRRAARRIMSEPTEAASERATLVGTVREVDLDASRFEIRNVEGHPDVRCAHELDDDSVKGLVDVRVRVGGRPERNRRGDIRLLWVDELEVLS